MKKKLTTLFIILVSFSCMSNMYAQDFPSKEWAATSHDKPLIFYISGDGGFNKFTTELCQSFNKNGYDVFSLNARSYFSDKKTPDQTATDVNTYLSEKLAARQNQQVVMVGYSFGADVLPFILNRLPQATAGKIKVSFLMAASGTTDFETHWSDMLGGNTKRSMDVVTELNKITNGNVVIINGNDDELLALNKITLKNYSHEVLPGGHHFDGDTDQVTNLILNYIK
jgi:type IV secretory pathway VirJ component